MGPNVWFPNVYELKSVDLVVGALVRLIHLYLFVHSFVRTFICPFIFSHQRSLWIRYGFKLEWNLHLHLHSLYECVYFGRSQKVIHTYTSHRKVWHLKFTVLIYVFVFNGIKAMSLSTGISRHRTTLLCASVYVYFGKLNIPTHSGIYPSNVYTE